MTYKKLTPKEKEEIRVLYRMGGVSYSQLAERYNSSKSTIKRVIKAEEEPLTQILPPKKASNPVKVINAEIPERIDFLHQKLSSLQESIDQANETGVLGAVASLHKIHKETYNEYQEELKKQQGTKSIEDPEQLVEIFMRNYLMLPVYLKDIIKGRIEEEG